jgi:hypothetical protein
MCVFLHVQSYVYFANFIFCHGFYIIETFVFQGDENREIYMLKSFFKIFYFYFILFYFIIY